MCDQYFDDNETYKWLTREEADGVIRHAVHLFYQLTDIAAKEKVNNLRPSCFSESHVTYAKREIDKAIRHSQFYVLAKVNKDKIPMPLCLVVRAAGSKLFSISTLLGTLLQPLLNHLPTYCSNSN